MSAETLAPLWGLSPTHSASAGTGRIGAAIWAGDGDEIWGSPDPDITVLGMSLHDYDIELFKDRRQVYAGTWRPGAVQIMPAGVEPRAIFKSRWHLLHVYMPTALLASVAGDGRPVEVGDPMGASDDHLHRLLRTVVAELCCEHGPHPLAIDGLGVALAAHLARGADARGATFARLDWRVRRTIEHLEARLCGSPDLAEIAAEVGLTPRHYARLFQAAIGLSPHTWVMKRRIERACEQLDDPRRSITEVALELGFASSQHFATAFRRHIGVTPSDWRRSRLT